MPKEERYALWEGWVYHEGTDRFYESLEDFMHQYYDENSTPRPWNISNLKIRPCRTKEFKVTVSYLEDRFYDFFEAVDGHEELSKEAKEDFEGLMKFWNEKHGQDYKRLDPIWGAIVVS